MVRESACVRVYPAVPCTTLCHGEPTFNPEPAHPQAQSNEKQEKTEQLFSDRTAATTHRNPTIP